MERPLMPNPSFEVHELLTHVAYGAAWFDGSETAVLGSPRFDSRDAFGHRASDPRHEALTNLPSTWSIGKDFRCSMISGYLIGDLSDDQRRRCREALSVELRVRGRLLLSAPWWLLDSTITLAERKQMLATYPMGELGYGVNPIPPVEDRTSDVPLIDEVPLSSRPEPLQAVRDGLGLSVHVAIAKSDDVMVPVVLRSHLGFEFWAQVALYGYTDARVER